MRFPLQGVVHLKLPTFLAATALQRKIVYAAGRNAPAPEASGRLSAQHELRSSRKGPRPPIFRLPSTDSFLSFHLQFTI